MDVCAFPHVRRMFVAWERLRWQVRGRGAEQCLGAGVARTYQILSFCRLALAVGHSQQTVCGPRAQLPGCTHLNASAHSAAADVADDDHGDGNDADADTISLMQVLYVVFSDGTASSLSYPPSTDR